MYAKNSLTMKPSLVGNGGLKNKTLISKDSKSSNSSNIPKARRRRGNKNSKFEFNGPRLQNVLEIGAGEKVEQIHMKEDGSIDFNHLKYNLNNLFDDTPVFDVPPMSFNLEGHDSNNRIKLNSSLELPYQNKMKTRNLSVSQSNDYHRGWGRIMNMILNEGEYKMKYIRNYEKIKERLMNQGRVPFIFKTQPRNSEKPKGRTLKKKRYQIAINQAIKIINK
mmetsp:Transcript_24626/g.21850  ORF Transcript_24626/g.21850 Transcript_24626/m.21850 type:complete len:221 (+) Transcript_24626:5-667(+)